MPLCKPLVAGNFDGPPGPELADKELAQTELIMVQFGPAQPKSTEWVCLEIGAQTKTAVDYHVPIKVAIGWVTSSVWTDPHYIAACIPLHLHNVPIMVGYLYNFIQVQYPVSTCKYPIWNHVSHASSIPVGETGDFTMEIVLIFSRSTLASSTKHCDSSWPRRLGALNMLSGWIFVGVLDCNHM